MGNIQDCAGAREISPCGDTKRTRKSFGSMSMFKSVGEHRARGDFVLFIDDYEVSTSLCPEGSCFVDVKVVNSSGNPVSRECTVERGFISFSIVPEDSDAVVISVYDCATIDFIGSARVEVGALRARHSLGSPGHFPLQDGEVGEITNLADSGNDQGSETRTINSDERDQMHRGKVSVSVMVPGQGPVADWGGSTALPEFEKEFFLNMV